MLQPEARASNGWPGTASTSRPWSSAMRAVIRLPDLAAASTTTTARVRPETMRLRAGKCRAWATACIGASVSTRPLSAISCWSAAFSGG